MSKHDVDLANDSKVSRVEFRLECAVPSGEPARRHGIEHNGLVYEMYRHDEKIWSVTLDLGGAAPNPFREEHYWFEAGVVAIGGGDVAYLVDLVDGTLRKTISIPTHFGHFAHVIREAGLPDELFLVLSWTGIEALDRTLSRVWIAKNLAVDGATCTGGVVQNDTIVVQAEMDPPGGWFQVELDFSTGRELNRQPAFSEGYVGIYGSDHSLTPPGSK